MDQASVQTPGTDRSGVRSRRYLLYLMAMMGLVAIMDQYLSTVKTSAIPYLLEEYGISAARFSWLEALYLISSFFIFALNGLNDIIGRKWAILILVLLMGLSSLGILVATPRLHLFMAFYALAIFATVSNMWTIPISEESVAETRARNVSIVYVIGLIPLQALLPPLLIDRLGLDWRWMYGVMSLFMIPILVMWLFMRETHRYDRVSADRTAGRRRRVEIRTRVDHLRVLPQRIEIIRDVIVVGHRLPVAAQRVPQPHHPRPSPLALLQRAQRLLAEALVRQPLQIGRQPQSLAPGRRAQQQPLGCGIGGLHAALHVKIVVQIGLAQRHLVAGQKHGAQRPRMAQHHDAGPRRLIGPDAAVPQPDAQRGRTWAKEPCQQVPSDLSGLCCSLV